jgi:hypothetical protein
MGKQNAEKPYSSREIAQRTHAMLRGAFAGAPTPLKEIPTKSGASRAHSQKRKKRA